MPRLRVYISGPISNGGKATPAERLENVKAACFVAADLIDRGYAVLCPQLTEHLALTVGRDLDHAVWMENDFPWVAASDAVLRMPAESVGSDMEVEHAYTHCVPVFFSLEALDDWRRSRAVE